MLAEAAYWTDRKTKYAAEWTEQIGVNASRWLRAVNTLLTMFEAETGIKRERLSSGWRPQGVNDVTSNAAAASTHLTGEGGDVYDPDRAFAAWCLANMDKVAQCGLYMEDPRWTPTWVHLQTRAPKSGKRVYIPSAKPPLAPPLGAQKPLPHTVRV